MTFDPDVYTDTWGIPQFENRGSPVLNILIRFQLKPWMYHATPGKGKVRDTISNEGFALEVPDDV